MHFNEDGFIHPDSPNRPKLPCAQHYKRLQELRENQNLREKSFSLSDSIQLKEYEEVRAQLLFFGCPYEELRLEGMAFLFIPASEADFISTSSERSSIRRILERIHGKK